MSYKFQRLREKIRQSVATGELSGKLPGERELARRFHVNAKTLSKALTDLAAEGLLQRSIGRGTFVKGSNVEVEKGDGEWLVLIDEQVDQALVRELRSLNGRIEAIDKIERIRPSFLVPFAAVIDLAKNTPDEFLRNLLIRNMSVVSVGRAPRVYSTSAVLFDEGSAATRLAREMMLAGHRRFLAIEAREHTAVAQAIAQVAGNLGYSVTVDACAAREAASAVQFGATACICESMNLAAETLGCLAEAGISVPGRVSVGGMGWDTENVNCTGYFVSPREKASAVVEVLRQVQPGRPAMIWMAGKYEDRGTISALPSREVVAEEADQRANPLMSLESAAIVG